MAEINTLRLKWIKNLAMIQIGLSFLMLMISVILILSIRLMIFGGPPRIYNFLILTLLAYGILGIIASVNILRSKEIGRKMLIWILLVALFLEIIFSISDIKFFLITFLKMLYEIFLLYYLNKKNVKDYFRRQNG